MAGLSASEKRIVELHIKATGDADLKRMAAELRATRVAAQDAQKSLGGIGGALSSAGTYAKGFIASLGVQQVIAWGRAILDTADALDAAAEQAGIGVERYQTLKEAFRSLEVDAKEFETGMEKLGLALSDVLAGNTTKATEALDRLGVKAKILSGQIDSVDGVVDGLANSHKALNNDITITTDLADILGKKLAGDYSSAFRSGALATEEMRIATEAFGVVSAQQIQTLAMASETVDSFSTKISNAALIASASILQAASSTNYWITLLSNLATFDIGGIIRTIRMASDEAVSRAALPSENAFNAQLQALVAKPTPPVIPTAPGKPKGGGGGSRGETEAQRLAAQMEKIYAQNLKDVNALLKERREALAEAQQAQSDYLTELERAADPELAYAERMQKVNDARATGLLTARAYATEAAAALRDYNDAQRELIESSPEWQKANNAMLDGFDKQRQLIEQSRQQWEYLADQIGQATYDVISGAASISQAIKQMVASILSEVARIAAVKLAAQIVGALFSAGTAGVSKGGGGSIGKPIDWAAGIKLAQGGVVTGSTAFATSAGGVGIMGEAGPEVVAPLRRDGRGNLGVGAVAPRVTVNNYAGAEVRASSTPEGVQIDIVRRVIADDIRRGGNQVSSAIEGAYRVGRQASAFA